jgi:hypothetical protein
MGNSTELRSRSGRSVRNLKPGFTRDQHFAPGTIVRIQVDTASPLGIGLPPGRSVSTTALLRHRRRLRVAEGVGRARYPTPTSSGLAG